jgi:hypothetical protein
VDYFREIMDPNSNDLRNRRTGSFLNKLIPFLADPTMLAAFAAPQRRVDWAQIVAQRQTVLIDVRHEHDPDRRRFKLLYWFRDLIDHIKHRGMAGRGQEIVFVIDEITQLLGHRTQNGQSILAEDLEELVAVLGRNFGVNLIISHQNLSQVDERIRNVLMQMGTQMIGVTPNPEDALYLAQQLVPYDPFLVKKREPVWMGLSAQTFFGNQTEPTIIDYTTTEFTAQEQQIMAATGFQRLGRFQFIVRPAMGEGDVTGKLKRITIANLDYNEYPNEAQMAPVRRVLAQRDGIPVETLLAELQKPPEGVKLQKQMKSDPRLAILKGEEGNTDAASSHHLSTTAASVIPTADSAGAEHSVSRPTGKDDDFWR